MAPLGGATAGAVRGRRLYGAAGELQRGCDGVPAFEQCFGYVPLLASGGSPDGSHLRLGRLYEHLAVIARLTGQPQVRRRLPMAPPAGDDTASASADRLVEVGRALFAKLRTDPVLNVVELPDGLGVCLVHAVRGGGKIYVAPDGRRTPRRPYV